MYINTKTGCVAAGFAARDGEYSELGDKRTPVLKFSLAVGKDANDETIWFNCQAWNPAATRFKHRIKKGETYAVFGTWERREHNGKTYHTLNVQYIGDMAKTGESNTAGTGAFIDKSDDVLDESELPF